MIKILVRLVISSLLLFFSLALQAQDAVSRIMPQKYTKGILWKIEKQGVSPSYLMGTVHLDHPKVIGLFEGFREIFQQSKMVCTEVEFDFKAAAAEMMAMFYQDGRTLKSVLTDDDLYQKLISVAQERGLQASLLNSMKPWAVMYMLSVPLPQGEVLDQKIFSDAQRQGKKVCGLEKVEDHVNAFDAFNLQEQIEMLRVTLESIDLVDTMNSKVFEAYLTSDLQTMAELVVKAPVIENRQLLERFVQKLVIERNQKMFNNMKPHLNKGSGFFAVGSMHLTGSAGLLRLLEAGGYTLTRIY